jgi:hypothetical protein
MSIANKTVLPCFEKQIENNGWGSEKLQPVGGIRMREYFAGLIAQGCVGGAAEVDKKYAKTIAANAVMVADALIAELDKGDK